MANVNKYAKFLEKKTKELEGKGSFEKREYLPFFNPTKYLGKMGKKPVVARVLPRKGELFFLQFKKHAFKVGTTWKITTCTYSKNAEGESIGTSCPFCDFIEENKKELDKDLAYKLKAKDSYTLLVYNYNEDEVQKYEVNDYGISDILMALQKLDDDFDPDEEGFELVFTKDPKTGYSRIDSAVEPEETIEELMEKSEKFKEIPDLEKEVLPVVTEGLMKVIDNTFEYGLKAFAPTYAKKGSSNDDSDDEEKVTKATKFNKNVRNYDPNDDDMNMDEDGEEVKSKNKLKTKPKVDEDEEEEEEVKPKTKTKVKVEDDSEDNNNDSDSDDDVEDIKAFIRNRKK